MSVANVLLLRDQLQLTEGIDRISAQGLLNHIGKFNK